MNKIDINEEKASTLNINEDKTIYVLTKSAINKVFNVGKNAKLTVYHYSIDSTSDIKINLNGENANVEYHYSTISYNDNILKMNINHNSKKTISNVYNHGVNVLENKLSFYINGIIPKNIDGCVCNQENQIINIVNGQSTILPNLLIDNYDVSSSHSAYIGKFRDEVLFYLMSRGISKEKATHLLIEGLLISGGDLEKEEVIKFQTEIENI